MRKIVFVRVGLPIPDPTVSAALKPHIANPQTAQAFPFPGGVISVFDTESTDEQIANDVKSQTGAMFFVFTFDAKALRMPDGIMESITSVQGVDFGTPAEPASELTIDEVLQKVHDLGMESLTPAEKAILERGV